MKIYLAGPMRNLPQFNFPAFFEAAKVLRNKGFEVVSPAEIDDAEDKGAALASPDGNMQNVEKTWGDFLARDVKLIADTGIEGIIFLPNWEQSKGARLEAYVGLLGGLSFFAYGGDNRPLELDPSYVAGICAAQWMPREVKVMAGVVRGNFISAT